MLSIMMKPPQKRSNEDNKHIAAYLRFRFAYFNEFTSDLILPLSERLENRIFKRDDYLMRHGDKADCMFVIIKG